MSTPPSVALARALLDAFIAAGVTEAVLSPGSRNAPLSVALAEADATGRIRLHVRIDERTAGFLAVGLAHGSGRPAIVCTTSGTAVANLHPAVLEAHHGAVPLIVLSADRPPALRALGANQVIDQVQVFSPALRHFAEIDTPVAGADPGRWWAHARDAVAAATRAVPGPVQLNLPFDVPLLPGEDDEWIADRRSSATDSSATDPTTPDPAGRPIQDSAADLAPDIVPVAAPAPGERVLFVADLTHPAAGPVAAAGHPVVAEAGGAAGRAVMGAGIPLLEAGFAGVAPPDRVVVLGRPTLYRAVTELLRAAPVVDVVGPTGPVADPTGRARRVSRALAPIGTPDDPAFRNAWRDADSAAAAAIAARLADADLMLGPRLARAVVAAAPAGAALVLGASQTPRDVGRFSMSRDGLQVVATRGVAGIDGTVSTALGVALARPDVPTVALMGDLTFLHDLNGLVIGPHEPRPDLTIVVANNDGGAVFATLEPGEPRHSRVFERVFGTPHGVQLASMVEAVGIEHVLVTDIDQLQQELAAAAGIRVLEVPTGRTELRQWLSDTRAAVASALAQA